MVKLRSTLNLALGGLILRFTGPCHSFLRLQVFFFFWWGQDGLDTGTGEGWAVGENREPRGPRGKSEIRSEETSAQNVWAES